MRDIIFIFMHEMKELFSCDCMYVRAYDCDESLKVVSVNTSTNSYEEERGKLIVMDLSNETVTEASQILPQIPLMYSYIRALNCGDIFSFDLEVINEYIDSHRSNKGLALSQPGDCPCRLSQTHVPLQISRDTKDIVRIYCKL
jgi:hypothetical protein